MRGAAFMMAVLSGIVMADSPGHCKASRARFVLVCAEWCHSCKSLKTVKRSSDDLTDFEWLKKGCWRLNETEDSDVQLVDYDKHRELAISYNVVQVPTLIVLLDGKELARESPVSRSSFENLRTKLDQAMSAGPISVMAPNAFDKAFSPQLIGTPEEMTDQALLEIVNYQPLRIALAEAFRQRQQNKVPGPSDSQVLRQTITKVLNE